MPVKSRFQPYVCIVAFIQVALLGGCNRSEVAERADRQQKTAVEARAAVQGPERLIVAFGDSLYAGYGLKANQSMPAQVEQRLRTQGINAKVVKVPTEVFETPSKS